MHHNFPIVEGDKSISWAIDKLHLKTPFAPRVLGPGVGGHEGPLGEPILGVSIIGASTLGANGVLKWSLSMALHKRGMSRSGLCCSMGPRRLHTPAFLSQTLIPN